MFLHKRRGGRPVILRTSSKRLGGRPVTLRTPATTKMEGRRTSPSPPVKRRAIHIEQGPTRRRQARARGERTTRPRGPPPKYHQQDPPSHDIVQSNIIDRGCSRPPRRNNSETARHNKGCGRDQYHANTKTSSFYLLTNVKSSRRKRQREANDRRCLRALRSRIQRDSTFPFGP